ncbi:MAG: 5-formyltetrahydrofolate cyclo-ligase [Flavobacterium sp.]|nr:5-formyltetrahydrofolate cyclo-ligase [Flavobacterium sp.]
MNKKDVRIKYKKRRQELSLTDIENLSLSIANNILKMDIWDKTYFHVFLPIVSQNEVNTEFILHLLQGKDKEVVISKSDFQTLEMTQFLLTDNTKIKLNQYQIPEPIDGIEVPNSKIDVVFVPLLAFDKTGNRIGYGKGFYDKFLSQCLSKTIKIGLSFFDPEDSISDFSQNDILLDYCVTPNKVYQFI